MLVNTRHGHFFNVVSVNILSDMQVCIIFLDHDDHKLHSCVVDVDPDFPDLIFGIDPDE